MRLEHHLVGGYVRYISPYIVIIIIIKLKQKYGDSYPTSPQLAQNPHNPHAVATF